MAKEAKKYAELKEPTREQVVRQLMEAGGSNKSVGKELGVSPNTIASYRHRKGIPSTNEAPVMRGQRRTGTAQARSSVMSDTAESPVPLRLKMATSEATQCMAKDEDGMQCGFKREEGSKYCAKPAHQALEERSKKKPARR